MKRNSNGHTPELYGIRNIYRISQFVAIKRDFHAFIMIEDEGSQGEGTLSFQNKEILYSFFNFRDFSVTILGLCVNDHFSSKQKSYL